MKPYITVLLLALGGVSGAIVNSELAAQGRSNGTTLLLKKDLEGCQGKELTIYVLDAGPGTSGYHQHPGESFTYVLEGTQTREARGEATTTATAGGFIYDGPMQIHRTENTARVKLLIVRVLDKGKPSTIRAE